MELAIGHVLQGADEYRVLRVLGQGAMGAVYEAESVRIRRRVAIKAIQAGLVGRRDTVMRFELEAQAASRIGSRHITEVLDTGELADGTRFMVMEFLEGMTLHERIRSRGRLKPAEIAPIAIELLEGLAAAHRAGIVHRDLKPANIFLVKTGGADFVKLLDFGVSKFNVLDGGEGMNMTSTGMILGTPFYMSPEQAKGSRNVDRRSDLYSTGVILYEAITGQVPFSAETFNELIFRIVLESPPPAEQFVPDLDGAFAVILRKAMARDADQRFQSADEFRAALVAWLEVSGSSFGLAQGGTMMMPGARGGTLMLDSPAEEARTWSIDGAPTIPFANAAAPAGAEPRFPPAVANLPRIEAPRRSIGSGAKVAIVVMSMASVVMGGGAIVVLTSHRAATRADAPSVNAEASSSAAAPASPSTATAPAAASEQASAPAPSTSDDRPSAEPPPSAEPATSGEPPPKSAEPPTPEPAVGERPSVAKSPARRAPPPRAPAPSHAPATAAAPGAAKRTISGDL